MNDIRQQILEYIEALPGDSVKEAVQAWVKFSDGSLIDFERQLADQAASQSQVDTTIGFPCLSHEEAIRESESRWQRYQQTQQGIPHDRVVQWLDSVGTENELPCPK
jgi:predicted transcriptional regulator